MKNMTKAILFLMALYSATSFAGQQGGNGTPPAKTIETLLSEIESSTLESSKTKVDLNFTINRDELLEIVKNAPGVTDESTPITATTRDGKQIQLIPSNFDISKGVLSIPVGSQIMQLHRTESSESRENR